MLAVLNFVSTKVVTEVENVVLYCPHQEVIILHVGVVSLLQLGSKNSFLSKAPRPVIEQR
jgi:hypothetical protein